MSRNPDTVRFDVGGTIYRVSRSLIQQYPDTMLARITSDTWSQQRAQSDGGGGVKLDDEPIFLERDGGRFRHVLDYMRDGGRIHLPHTVCREAFLRDLDYFGFVPNDDDPTNRAKGITGGCSEESGTQKDCDTIMKFFLLEFTFGMNTENLSRSSLGGSITVSFFPSPYLINSAKYLNYPIADLSYEAYKAAGRVFLDDEKTKSLNERFLNHRLRIHKKELRSWVRRTPEPVGRLKYWEVTLNKILS